ncbi:hypothetical protein ACHAP7_010535 [Fusarium lateritium]
MDLCQICASLDLASIIRMKVTAKHQFEKGYPKSEGVLRWIPGDYESRRAEASLVPYHTTVAGLIRNADICNLCQVVYRSITSTVDLLEKVTQSTPTVSSVLTHRVFICGLGLYQGLQIISYDENQDPSTPVYQLLGGVGFANDIRVPHELLFDKIPDSPRSTGTVEFIKRCLRIFKLIPHRHKTLARPSRLLRYDEEIQKVILCSAVPPDAEYAALSHCWGSVQPLTLNSQTASQLREGLPIGDFPQTFQDAFWLVEQLKIPYLWIDSLCILQDSKDDWIHESSRMCDVYGNAYLMIAAVSAKNCTEGFLGPRDQGYIDIPLRSSSRSDMLTAFPMPNSQTILGCRTLFNSVVADFADEPLSKRGWTLQERYLSPCKVHFTRSKVYFEDETSLEAEDGTICPTEYSVYTNFENEKVGLYDGHFQPATRRCSDENWEHLTTRYSRRSLTVDSDKFPAIAGLAAYRSSQNSQKAIYLAGLWNNDIIRGMSWKVDNRFPLAGGSKSYIAPSWSWASVNSGIRIPFSPIEELAIVKDVAVYLENAINPFGRVTGGWVHLSATKLQLHVDPEAQGGQDLWFEEGEFCYSLSVEWDSPRAILARILGGEMATLLSYHNTIKIRVMPD